MHTGYSMQDGIIKPDDAVDKAKEDGMPALAITDLGNVMSSVHFYEHARKAGVKPIVGIDITVENPEQDDKNTKPRHRMTILVQSEQGYFNLNKIISRAYVENKKDENAVIKREWLETMATDGLIALSGATEGCAGDFIAQNRLEDAKKELLWLSGIFGNDRMFVELQRDGRLGQEAYVGNAVALAGELNLPVVATHMNQFLKPEDYDAHDVRVVVSEGGRLDNPSRNVRFTREQYFKTTAEMQELFQDIPVALENTVEIAKRCNFTINLGKPELPRFPTENNEAENDMLVRLAKAGLEKRLEVIFPNIADRDANRKKYDDRLNVELGVINGMGFPGYFLIVQDFINWAKNQDIPVGPGRGSGAGSLVAYSLRITDIDPLPYDLLFERFLNPERVSMPDFDIDFCRERRSEVVEYVRKKYGYNNVSQIATAGTMESKAVIKDVARSMGITPMLAQELTDMIPKEQNVPISLSRALVEVPKLKEKYDTDPEMRKLFDWALTLEGTPRQFGMHAAGVVIAPRDITEFTPLYYDGKGVTGHFDMKDIEKLGLVKFDFLGLDTLTVIHKAQKMIRALPGNENFDIDRIPLDDEKAYDIFRRGNTTAVFQSEGGGMRKMQVQLKPSNLEDVIASMALYRPGPLNSGMVDHFIACKHGLSAIEYPHPSLEKILKPTYGVIVYQEQVMQIAQELAGYSLGTADLLRRAMGKKDANEMAKQRVTFTEGAVNLGVNGALATEIFDLMEKFAEYGFNKSHSAAYGWLAYQTAYLKAHFPLQLYAGALASKAEDGKFEKMAELVDDARKNGYQILPPDINKSTFEFKPEGEKGIRFGLSGVKGVGESVALVVQAEREKNGDYKDFFEMGARLGKGTINKRVRDALINAGAFDTFGHSRETLFENSDALQDYLVLCDKSKNKSSVGEVASVFSEIETGDTNQASTKKYPEPPVMKIAEKSWPLLERLAREFKVFDFYFSGHPYQAYSAEMNGLRGVVKLDELMPSSGPIYAAGIVTTCFERKAKVSGNPWASVTLHDGKTEIGVTVFGDVYQDCKDKLKEGAFVVIGGKTKDDTFQGQVQLNADYIYNRQEARTLTSKYLKIAINSDVDQNKLMEILDDAPKNNGVISSEVIVYARGETGPVKTTIGDPYRIVLTDAVIKDIEDLVGEENVKLHPRAELEPPIIADRKKSFSPRRK